MAETLHHDREAEDRVVIDADFFRNQARDAVRQFFRPITAPFERRPYGSKGTSEHTAAQGKKPNKRS